MEISASAPGKLFLLGEYAVTAGEPAVLCATDRRLECQISARSGSGQIRIIRKGGESYLCPPNLEEVNRAPESMRFAVAAVQVGCRAAGIADLDLEIAPAETLDRGTPKLGLGGSAAITAAILAGVAELPGAASIRDQTRRITLGVQAHRLAQQGGSGADVAAITTGGLAWVEGIGDAPPPRNISEAASTNLPDLSVSALELPAGLELRALATGRPARSGPRAAHFRHALAGHGPLGEAGAQALHSWNMCMTEATQEFRQACLNNNADLALRALADGGELFARLPVISGIPVWSPELRRLQARSRAESALSIKPSGAGGGDCAVALIRAPEPPFWQKDTVINSLGTVGLKTTGNGAVAQQESTR